MPINERFYPDFDKMYDGMDPKTQDFFRTIAGLTCECCGNGKTPLRHFGTERKLLCGNCHMRAVLGLTT